MSNSIIILKFYLLLYGNLRVEITILIGKKSDKISAINQVKINKKLCEVYITYCGS